MLETFLSVLANGLDDVELFLRHALMHQNTVNLHQTGAAVRWTESKFLCAFGNLQLRARPQSVAGPKRLWKNDTPELV